MSEPDKRNDERNTNKRLYTAQHQKEPFYDGVQPALVILASYLSSSLYLINT